MKKIIYGFYVLWLGLLVKTLKKKDLNFQMKFLQAAMKYTSMILILTFILVACTNPGSALKVGDGSEDENEKPLYTPGNWKSGLFTPTPIPTVETEEAPQNSPENAGTPTRVQEGLTIINSRFEKPDLSCNHAACPGISSKEITVLTTGELPGWDVSKGSIILYARPGVEGQWAQIQNGEITQTLGVRKLSKYRVTFSKAVGTSCNIPGELIIKWGEEKPNPVLISGVDWTTLETIYDNQQNEKILFGLEAVNTHCPILVKDISIVLIGDVEPIKEMTQSDILDDSFLIPNGDFESPEVLNPKRLETLPSWTLDENPLGFPVIVREGDNQYIKLYGPIVQNLESVSGSVYNLSITVRKPSSEGANCKVLYSINKPEDIVSFQALESESINWEIRNQVIEIDSGLSSLSLESQSGFFCDIDNVKFTYLRDINNQVVVPTPVPEPIELEDGTMGVPTPTPDIALLEAELQDLIDQLESSVSGVNDDRDPNTSIPTLVPQVTVTPVPSTKYDTKGSDSITETKMTFSIGPSVLSNGVSFTGTILDKVEPTMIQVWALSADSGAALSDATYKPEECSTEKPIVFFRKPLATGSAYNNTSTNVNWGYCINGTTTVSQLVIPYENATTWTFNTANGVFTFAGDKSVGLQNEWPLSPGTHAYVIIVLDSNGLVIRTEEVK